MARASTIREQIENFYTRPRFRESIPRRSRPLLKRRKGDDGRRVGTRATHLGSNSFSLFFLRGGARGRRGTVGEVGGNKVAAISSEEAEGKFLPSVRFSRSGIISFRLLERTKGGKGGGIGFAVSRNSRFIDSKSIDSRASESRAKY